MGYELETIWESMKETRYKQVKDELAKELAEAVELKRALALSLNKVVNTSHAVAGTLWTYERFGDGKIHAAYVYGGADMSNVLLEPGEGIAGQVIANGVSRIIANVDSDKAWNKKTDDDTGFKTYTMLCVPLNWKSFTVGCIQLINKIDGAPFDDKDQAFVLSLAECIVDGFENNGLLTAYIPNEAMERETKREAYQDISFSNLMANEFFEDVQDEIAGTEYYKKLSHANKKTLVRLMRESWKLAH